jgi:hypothetical protein
MSKFLTGKNLMYFLYSSLFILTVIAYFSNSVIGNPSEKSMHHENLEKENYSFDSYPISKSQIKYVLRVGDKVISYKFFLELIGESDTFRSFFVDILGKSEFEAFKFETKPINQNLVEKYFEFILINMSNLVDIEPDKWSFMEHWKR